MTKIRLLLVEDNDTDALLVVRQLKKEGLDVEHLQVKTREEMEKALQDEWDLVISDYSLPGFGGKDALELFTSKRLDIPFILVSGTVGEDIAVSIMKGGANDYLMKTHLHRLGPAVKRELEETKIKREKKRIESVLTQTEKRFQRLIEDLRDVVFLSSMDGQKIYIINAAFEAIYGRFLKELDQNPLLWFEAIHDDDKALIGPMSEELKRNGVSAGEYRIVRPDQTIRWVYDRRCLVFTDGEQEPLMGGVVMDVTEKKQAEEELIQAKKAAEESSRLKSALLQNMSHEFRTPMNGILGFSEILREELADEDSRDKAEYILTSGRRLQQTLDAIMLYAQLESGFPLNPANFNLSVVLRECMDTFKGQTAQKGLSMDLFSPDDLPVLSDCFLVKRILFNILDNAVKFTDQGSIEISAAYSGADRRRIIVKVKDTGVGIPMEKQSIIFEAFRQAEEGYNRPYEGSGLGLSIANKCIRLLSGEISLESSTAQGTTVSIILPVSWKEKVPSQPVALGKGTPPAAARKIPEDKAFPILLVEDNEANIELIRLFLPSRFDLDVAKEGKTCMEKVTQKQYDCILMDINLGQGMNGIDAIAEIRKLPSYKATPIVAVTGYTFRNEKDFIIEQGATHYLEKPFNRKVMMTVLDQVFG